MTTRAPRTKTFHFAVSGIPATMTEEMVKKIIEDAVGQVGAAAMKEPPVAAISVKPAKVELRNRKIRHTGMFACRRTPDPLWAAAIIWPKGVPQKGCGRAYASEAMRDAHEAGYADRARTKQWNPVMFPHGCLDRIVPADLRDK